MPIYQSIAHVLWELPFPLRLPPVAFLCWEPTEGHGLFDPGPEVGELSWKRKSSLVKSDEVFRQLAHPRQCFPPSDYRIVSRSKKGREIVTAQIMHGPDGGFIEVRPYSIANIFLCLRSRDGYSLGTIFERAGLALNNILNVYRLITMDPLVRSVRVDQDSYYTTVSTADLPGNLGDVDARVALQIIESLRFSHKSTTIGVNNYKDLISGDVIPDTAISMFESFISEKRELEIYHQLVLSAIRRLKRKEHALAIIDAQSAFESVVATSVAVFLSGQGKASQQIKADMSFCGSVHTLQQRLKKLDSISGESTRPGMKPLEFLGSPEEAQWREKLYEPRNQIVHEGLREISFADAKAGLVAGLHAINKVHMLEGIWKPSIIWSGSALNINHLGESSGRLSRIFEV